MGWVDIKFRAVPDVWSWVKLAVAKHFDDGRSGPGRELSMR